MKLRRPSFLGCGGLDGGVVTTVGFGGAAAGLRGGAGFGAVVLGGVWAWTGGVGCFFSSAGFGGEDAFPSFPSLKYSP